MKDVKINALLLKKVMDHLNNEVDKWYWERMSFEDWNHGPALSCWMPELFEESSENCNLKENDDNVFTPVYDSVFEMLSVEQRNYIDNLYKKVWDRRKNDVDNLLRQNNNGEQFSMKLIALEEGNAYVQLINKNKNYLLVFGEELFGDGYKPFNEFAKLYNSLKKGQNYQFMDTGGDFLFLKVENIDDSTVSLNIDAIISNKDGKIIINENINRYELMTVIENLFSDILQSPEFPFQYPCYEYSRWIRDNVITEESLQKHIPFVTQEFIESRLAQYEADKKEQYEISKNHAEKFKNMLTCFRVPDDWD